MVQKIKALFEKYLGLEINYIGVPPKIDKTELKGKNNLVVEFIGAMGSGKSFVCNAYLKRPQNNYSTISNRQLDRYKSIITKRKERRLSGFHDTILSYKIQYLAKQKKSGSKKYFYLNSFLAHLERDFIANTFFSDQTFIWDESLFHYFKDLPYYFPDSSLTEQFLSNRLFIYCNPSEEQHVLNIQRKIKEGFWLKSKNFTQQELIDFTRKHRNARGKAYEVLRAKGGKILEIDSGADVKKNCVLIDEFIRKYR